MTTRISQKDAKKFGLIPKRHKYRAVPTVVDGIRFASKKEAKRYGKLKAMEKAGQIQGLTLQPSFALNIRNTYFPERRTVIGSYKADFAYQVPVADCQLGSMTTVYEDVKGYRTPVYRLKKKLVEALYGIKIVEV